MGHRFSKTAANNIAAKTTTRTTTTTATTTQQQKEINTTNTRTNIIPIPNGVSGNNQQQQQFVGPLINLQIQESPNTTTTCNTTTTATNSFTDNNQHTAGILQQQQQNTNNSISSSLTSVNNLSCGRQIIIKIQLAKMENGNETSTTHHHPQQDCTSLESLTSTADCNLNSSELATTVTAAGTQFLNLTLNSTNNTISSCSSSSNNINTNNCNSLTNPLMAASSSSTAASAATSSSSAAASLFRTAGSSLNRNNNYLNSNSGTNTLSSVNMLSTHPERRERFNCLQFNDEIVEQNIGEIVEYCEVLEDHHQQQRQYQQPETSGTNSLQMLAINEGELRKIN